MVQNQAVTFDFPDDLVQAQRDLQQATAELEALYAELPWSVEPAPAWEREDRWSKTSFPDSPGWTDGQKQQVEGLRARRLDLATKVMTHDYWDTLSGPDVVAARSALKHVDDETQE